MGRPVDFVVELLSEREGGREGENVRNVAKKTYD